MKHTVEVSLAGHGRVTITLAPSHSSLLLRCAPWTRGAWVTIGTTVYYPRHITKPEQHLSTLAHEYVHVLQWKRYSVLLWIGYVLGVPLPFFLAFVRTAVEAEAYAHEVVHYGRDRTNCITAMTSSVYGWLGPRRLVVWFLDRAIRRRS